MHVPVKPEEPYSFSTDTSFALGFVQIKAQQSIIKDMNIKE